MLSELISCHLRKDVAMAICSCTIDRMCVGVFFFAHMVAVVDSFQTSESFSCKLQLRKSKHVLDR